MIAHDGAPVGWRQRIPLATIDKVVAARLGHTRVSGSAHPAVFNRQIAMYLAKHVGGWSTTQIGRFYNGRDRSTVCYAVKKIEMLRNAQPDVDELLVGLHGEIVSEVEGNRTESHPTANHPAGQASDMLVTDRFLDLVIDRLLARLHRASTKGRHDKPSTGSSSGSPGLA
uniref:Chromosomal replication initiator, DnaA C-terminal domain n=1 Tax=Solibacter usitatus (strain Ellin6076) TaxID=234267 RepID=Q01PB0_SOLUE